jgi:hypothetical protein
VNGTTPREGELFGECATCPLGQFLNGKSPKCKQTRKLFFIEVDRDNNPCDAFIVTFTPSGLKPWRKHDNAVMRLARKSDPTIEAAPHHLVKVRITTDYIEEPSPHFIPVLEITDVAGKALADALREQRKVEAERFRQAHEAQEYKAEDFRGEDDGVPF